MSLQDNPALAALLETSNAFLDKQPLPNLALVKRAVDAGHKVFWANERYRVIKDQHDQYLVVWDLGGRQENATGLCRAEGAETDHDVEHFFYYGGEL